MPQARLPPEGKFDERALWVDERAGRAQNGLFASVFSFS